MGDCNLQDLQQCSGNIVIPISSTIKVSTVEDRGAMGALERNR